MITPLKHEVFVEDYAVKKDELDMVESELEDNYVRNDCKEIWINN